jgi:hypothetical protein
MMTETNVAHAARDESAGPESLDSPTSGAVREPMVDIELDSLVDDSGEFRTVEVRGQLDESVVDAYAAKMVAGEADTFPPIVVYEVTDRGGERYIAAGRHRCSAARQAVLSTLRAYLRCGTWHEALEAAIATNATHGHRPTKGDVSQTLLQMECDPQFRRMSNRQAAALIGVSEGTVRTARRRLEETAQVTRSDTVKVTRKDGTTYDLPKKASAHIPQSSTADDDDDVRQDVRQAVKQAVKPTDATPPNAASDDALTVLHTVIADVHSVIQRLRETGLETSVPPAVLRCYRQGDSTARQGDVRTLKAAVATLHQLSMALRSGKGKAA